MPYLHLIYASRILFPAEKKSGFKIVGYAAAASGTLQIPAVSLAMKWCLGVKKTLENRFAMVKKLPNVSYKNPRILPWMILRWSDKWPDRQTPSRVVLTEDFGSKSTWSWGEMVKDPNFIYEYLEANLLNVYSLEHGGGWFRWFSFSIGWFLGEPAVTFPVCKRSSNSQSFTPTKTHLLDRHENMWMMDVVS